VQWLPSHGPEVTDKAFAGVPQAGALTLSEVFTTTAADAAGAGFVLSILPRGETPLLWVQDSLSAKEAGRPYLPGLGTDRPLIHITLSRAADVLWALEEGLRCAALGAVIGEIWGTPPVLDFTATRRLAMRSEATGLPCWLIRHGAAPDLSAARNRWRITSLPSDAHPHDAQSPGNPRWQEELFRAREVPPGIWVVIYDRAADHIRFSAPLRDGALAEEHGAPGRRATG
jgi:protein ImuA